MREIHIFNLNLFIDVLLVKENTNINISCYHVNILIYQYYISCSKTKTILYFSKRLGK